MAKLNPVYKCAALVIFPKDKQLSLMLSAEGPTWALEELEKSKSEGPTKENRDIIGFLAKQGNREAKTTVLELSIEWKDAVSWGRVIGSDPRFFLRQEGYEDLYNGWRAFGFSGVRPT
jgi:hypothetical protein